MIADRHGTDAEIHLTPSKRRLLEDLRRAGGKMLGRDMTSINRTLASRMHYQGLVRWQPPERPGRAKQAEWVLTFTHRGLACLAQDGQMPEATKDVA